MKKLLYYSFFHYNISYLTFVWSGTNNVELRVQDFLRRVTYKDSKIYDSLLRIETLAQIVFEEDMEMDYDLGTQ